MTPELSEERRVLEQEIAKLLMPFEAKHGVAVKGMQVSHPYIFSTSTEQIPLSVRLIVELP